MNRTAPRFRLPGLCHHQLIYLDSHSLRGRWAVASFAPTFGRSDVCLLNSVVQAVGPEVESVAVLVVSLGDRPLHGFRMADVPGRIIIAADPLRRLSQSYVAYDPAIDRRWTSLLLGPDGVIRFELVREGPRGVGELLELIKLTEAVTG